MKLLFKLYLLENRFNLWLREQNHRQKQKQKQAEIDKLFKTKKITY